MINILSDSLNAEPARTARKHDTVEGSCVLPAHSHNIKYGSEYKDSFHSFFYDASEASVLCYVLKHSVCLLCQLLTSPSSFDLYMFIQLK